MSRVVITGGAGFIGSQLGFALCDHHDVVLVDNMSSGYADNLVLDGKKFENFILADVRDKKIYEIVDGADYVFHFAGISALPTNQEDPQAAVSNNVAGTANVLDACRYTGVKKFIFASTSAIYENNDVFPCSESDVVNPDLIYAITKLQSELLCKSFSSVYDLETVCLRFFNVYGPHQDFRRKSPPLMGYIIKELMANRSPLLHSDGKQRRDYVYIDDLIELMSIVMLKEDISGETFNVCSGSTISVEEIFNKIKSNMGVDVDAIYRDPHLLWEKYPTLYSGKRVLSKERLEKEVNKFALGNPEKTKRVLGWEAQVQMQEGIEKTIEYALSIGEK